MRKDEIKHIKNIKECLQFLKETFKKDQPFEKFFAYLPPDNDLMALTYWHIVTTDWFLYMGKNEEADDYRMCIEAIRKKFKGVRIIFCYQYHISIELIKNRGYLML